MKTRPTYLIIVVTILVLIDYYVPNIADLIDIDFHETHKQSIDIFFSPKDDMIGKTDSKPVLIHVIKTYHLTFNIVQLAITDKQPSSRTQYP